MTPLPRKTLGRTGLEVTQLGYGSMGLRGPRTWGVRVVSDADAERILNRVLDSGINFIDTSPDYGVSEERIGRYIGSRRAEYFLATKCGCAPIQRTDSLEIAHVWNHETIVRNLETSLQRLQTDHLDLLQFHGGSAQLLQQVGLIDLVMDYKSQRVIRHVGVSSQLPELNAFIDLAVFDTYQIPYSCLAPEHDEAIQRAAQTGAGIIIRGGIAHGGPEAEIPRPALDDLWSRARLAEILPEGMSPAELILRCTLGHPHCHSTIVGTCHEAHLEENLRAAVAGPLPGQLLEAIRLRVTTARPVDR